MDLRELGKHKKKLIDSSSVEKLLDMTVEEFVKKYKPPSTTYIVVRKGTKLFNVIKAVATGHPSIIIVINNERKPIGYLTDRHLLSMIRRKPRPRSLLASFSFSQMSIPIEKSLDIPVEDFMDKNPPIVYRYQTIGDVIKTMLNLDVPSVIVVDENETMHGVLTRKHLIKTVLHMLTGEPFIF